MLFESDAGADTDQPIIPNHYHHFLSDLLIGLTSRMFVTDTRLISFHNQAIAFVIFIVTRIPAPASFRFGFPSFQ